MTAMIDVVFQLLIFFLLTFKIVLPEGDFNIKMPRSTVEAIPDPNQIPPIKVQLRATADGELAEIVFNDESFGVDFDRLQGRLIALVGDQPGPATAQGSAEVELAADFQLKYVHTAEAISRISGYVRNGRIVKLIEKIHFTPPVGPLE